MADSDSAFKLMLELAPQDVVSRFVPGAEFVRMLSIELPRDPLRADALLLIRLPVRPGETEGRLYILHIEVQIGADSSMPWRLCQYAVQAYMREKLPVLSLVIYLEKCRTPTPPLVLEGPDRAILTFDYQVVRLWEEPVEEWLQSGQVALMPFVPLLKGATIASIEPAINSLNLIKEPVTRGSALNYLLFFASRTFGEELLTKFLEDHHMLSESYIIESPWYQYILRKGRQDGIQQGIEEGIQRGIQQGEEIGKEIGKEIGMQEGEVTALRDAITALAARRFPALEADLQVILPSITDPAQLRELVLLVGTAPDEAAVRQWLPTA